MNAKSSISIGLWKAGVTVGSSRGSSSGSSSSSSQAPDHNGVYYGREMYYYNKVENMTNAVNYEIVIDTNTLNKISEKISEVNDTYNLLSYNCANFSTDLWNIATGKSWWSGWFRTPSNVIDDIKNDYSNSYSSDNSLPYSSKFCYYENNAKVEWNMA